MVTHGSRRVVFEILWIIGHSTTRKSKHVDDIGGPGQRPLTKTRVKPLGVLKHAFKALNFGYIPIQERRTGRHSRIDKHAAHILDIGDIPRPQRLRKIQGRLEQRVHSPGPGYIPPGKRLVERMVDKVGSVVAALEHTREIVTCSHIPIGNILIEGRSGSIAFDSEQEAKVRDA